MKQRVSIITLGIEDIPRSRAFYEVLGWKPIKHEHGGSIVFFQCGGMVVALYPRHLLAEDAGVSPDKKDQFSGITLAYNVNSKEEVHETIEQARKAGAKILKEPQDVFWGGYHGYFADPDGHLWEVAHNPFTLVDDQGRFIMEETTE